MFNKRMLILFAVTGMIFFISETGAKNINPIQVKYQKLGVYSAWIFLPANYQKDDTYWPVMIYLHGASYRNKEMEDIKQNVPIENIKQNGDLPFIVIAPKCPSGQRWSTYHLKLLLDEAIKKYPIDESRIYMTGMSLGGFGTWEFACRYPERLAAAAPVCGGGKPDQAAAMKNVPVWAFHGDRDSVVPYRRTKSMVEALERVGGNVKFTCLPGQGHNIGSKVYSNHELYDWMLEHSR